VSSSSSSSSLYTSFYSPEMVATKKKYKKMKIKHTQISKAKARNAHNFNRMKTPEHD